MCMELSNTADRIFYLACITNNAVMSNPDFDNTINQYKLSLNEFVKGDPEPLKKIYSHKDDVSLANPFGPAVYGWKQVADTMERAVVNYRDGRVLAFDQVAKYVTPALAYTLIVERYEAKVGGRNDMSLITLRVTSLFRPEDNSWKVIHRHADTITTARPPDSVIQK